MTVTLLTNFPAISQLTQGNTDGHPDNNDTENCGPTDIAAGIEYLTGVRVAGGDLKDVVYGVNYTGPTAIPEYAPYVASHYHVAITSIEESTTAALVATVHQQVAAGHPTILCIPSLWGKEPPDPPGVGFLHFVIAYGEDDSAHTITAMNPWGGFVQAEPDSWWQERLRLGAVWAMSKIGEENTALMAGVPSGWHDDGTTLTAPNGIPTSGGFRAHILAVEWPALLQPVAPLYGVSGGDQQDFVASRRLVYSASANSVTEVGGPDYVAQAHTAQQQLASEQGVATQLSQEAASLNAQISSLKEQLAAAQAAATSASTVPDPKATAVLQAIAAFKAALALV